VDHLALLALLFLVAFEIFFYVWLGRNRPPR
jgi:hypothetical protein